MLVDDFATWPKPMRTLNSSGQDWYGRHLVIDDSSVEANVPIPKSCTWPPESDELETFSETGNTVSQHEASLSNLECFGGKTCITINADNDSQPIPQSAYQSDEE